MVYLQKTSVFFAALFLLAACESIQFSESIQTEGVADNDATDTDEAEIQILVPASASWVNSTNGASYEISGTCSGVDEVTVSIHNSEDNVNCESGAFTKSFTNIHSSLTAGTSYEITAVGADADGAEISDAVTVRMAAASPTVSILAIKNSLGVSVVGTSTNESSVYITVRANDPSAQVAIYSGTLCAGTTTWRSPVWTTVTAGVAYNSVVTKALAAGANTFSVKARNAGGTISGCSAGPAAVTYDNTPPSIAIDASTATPPGFPTYASSVSTTDATSTIANVENVPIYGTCSDLTRTITFYVGTTLIPSTAAVTCATGGIFSAILDFSDAITTDQTVALVAKTTDTAGNVKTSSAVSIIIDRAGPTASTISINGGDDEVADVDVELTLSASGAQSMFVATDRAACEAGSGTDWEDFASTKDLSLTGTGQAWVKFRDVALNVTSFNLGTAGTPDLSACTSDTVTFDPTVPALSFDAPFNVASPIITKSSITDGIEMTGTCTEEGQNITFKLYRSTAAIVTPTGTPRYTGSLACEIPDGETVAVWTTASLTSQFSDSYPFYYAKITQTKPNGATHTEGIAFKVDALAPTLTGIALSTAGDVKDLVWTLTTNNSTTNPVAKVYIGEDCAETYSANLGDSSQQIVWVNTSGSLLKFKLTGVSGNAAFDSSAKVGIILEDAAGNRNQFGALECYYPIDISSYVDELGPNLFLTYPTTDLSLTASATLSITVRGTGCESNTQTVSATINGVTSTTTCAGANQVFALPVNLSALTASATPYSLVILTTDRYGNPSSQTYYVTVSP